MMSDGPAECAAMLFDEASRLLADGALAAASATVRRSLRTMRRAVGDWHPDVANDHPTLLAARDCLSALTHHPPIDLEDS